ncbi:MAG: sensor histidine kinase [Desulfuromonadales bacterium]|nr:sensor histidine kinase [Desulfuromonadales bacterium]
MTESTLDESYPTETATKVVSVKKRYSPVWWRPGMLLAIIFTWICVAELTDVLFLHELSFSSDLVEALVDVMVLGIFLSPTYFLFYRPLKAHWQQEIKARQEVRQLSHKLLRAAEDERRKLALELHDHFGQMVTTLQCKAERIQWQISVKDITALQTCESLMETISQLGHDIRGFTSELRPDMLDDLGLVETLKWYVSGLAKEHPLLQIEYSAAGVKQRLHADIEIALYRVCQEALNNIIKHANASFVSVTLTYCHPLIILKICDNGGGFSKLKTTEFFEKKSGFGLLGMRERLAAVGGSLELSSKPGEKTTVRALIPIKGEAESAWL